MHPHCTHGRPHHIPSRQTLQLLALHRAAPAPSRRDTAYAPSAAVHAVERQRRTDAQEPGVPTSRRKHVRLHMRSLLRPRHAARGTQDGAEVSAEATAGATILEASGCTSCRVSCKLQLNGADGIRMHLEEVVQAQCTRCCGKHWVTCGPHLQSRRAHWAACSCDPACPTEQVWTPWNVLSPGPQPPGRCQFW